MNNERDMRQFGALTDLLSKAAPDGEAEKERIYRHLLRKLEKGTLESKYTIKDDLSMRTKKWKTVAATAAALVCLTGVFATTSYAQEMVQSILARFQVGNLQITQYDRELPRTANLTTEQAERAERSEQAERAGKAGQAESGVRAEEQAQVGPAPVPPEQAGRVQGTAPAKMTLDEARSAWGVDFPAPTWMAEYEFVNCVRHGGRMVEVQYKNGDEVISLLISQGGENGIGTTEEVKTETIGGSTVYFANGIVIWEHDGFTFELYQMAENNFDAAAIGNIIASLSTEAM